MLRYEIEVDQQGWVIFGRARDPRPLPEELVVRSFDLRLDDNQQLVAFIDNHGVDRIPFFLRWEAPFREWGPSQRPDIHPDAERYTHLEDIRWSLALGQTLVLHWLLHVDNKDPLEAWRNTDLGREVTTTGDAWRRFVRCLNAGMAGAHMRVEVDLEGERLGSPAVNLYDALIIQLGNIIADGLPPRRCANETCTNYFVRQQGRAQHGQYRSGGVIYCSVACARAVANRNYRKRKTEGGTK